MASILKSDGVPLIFIGEADLYRPDRKYQHLTWMKKLCKTRGRLPSHDSLAKGMELYNDTLQGVAENDHIPFVRADRLIPKEPRYLRDDVHLTAEGNKMLAEAIRGVIKSDRTLAGYFAVP
jgi:lysophospholipase L1-like esterase